ncbi:MAG: serpin family protein [Methanoregula sp.]
MERKTIGIGTIAAIILLCVIVLSGCTGSPDLKVTPRLTPTPQVTSGIPPVTFTPVPVSGNEKNIADANNRFATDLYLQLAQDQDNAGKNIFFSPFSISTALAITYEGARGTTADEIQSVFHFPANDSERRQGFTGIITGINSGDASYTLRTANALWAEKTYPFLTDYTDTADRWYSAKTTNLDFINKPEDSRVRINQWVEEKTNNRIKDLIPAGAIDPMVRLVITNAVYFKGTWIKQFDINKTVDADFRVTSNKTTRVPMMERTDEGAIFRYADTADLQVLEMPYEHTSGKQLSMIVLLPKVNNLSSAERALDPKALPLITGKFQSQRVKVWFPKFKMETEYRLPESLTALGMPTAFSPAADFSGMDGTKNLFISDVIHKAFVDVNEEGTEAAAATAVIMKYSAAAPENPIPEFRADHPFLFLIQDDETGTVLFIGRVVNPAAA